MSTMTTERFLPRGEIEDKAKQVLGRWGMSALPVDPLAIAHREGVGVLTVAFLDESMSGSITLDATGTTTIRLNRQDSPVRKRYTIGHELGHYFLHLVRRQTAGGAVPSGAVQQFTDGTNNLFRQPSKARQQASDEARREYQANLFAAALLMPEDDVRTLWQKFDSVCELARVFDVSDQAMSIRLGQLGLLDVSTA